MEPLFSDAVQVIQLLRSLLCDELRWRWLQVLNAESGHLDPMRVLDALSETMPLSLAYPTLAQMLRERTHRKRQNKITHHLQKLQNVLYKAEK